MSTVARSNYHVGTAKLQKTSVTAGGDRVAATDTQVELARAGDVEAAKFSKTEITIKSNATVVSVKGGDYSSTNHYIRQSRGYVKKDGNLRQFINYPLMGYSVPVLLTLICCHICFSALYFCVQ